MKWENMPTYTWITTYVYCVASWLLSVVLAVQQCCDVVFSLVFYATTVPDLKLTRVSNISSVVSKWAYFIFYVALSCSFL